MNAPETTRGPRWRWLDAVFVTLLVAAAAVSAAGYLASQAQTTSYLLKYFGPAVSYALEGTLEPPHTGTLPAVNAFLDLDRPDLPLRLLPEELPKREASNFERLHPYGMMALGLAWRHFGIHWGALNGLLTLGFALLCLGAYAFFRAGAGRFAAFAAAMAIVASPAILYILPQYRDFSKAPFLIAELAVLAWIVRRRLNPLPFLATAAGMGLLLGIGLGFRHDFLAHLPAVLVVFAVFSPGPLRQTWWLRLAAPAVIAAVFYAVGAPALRAANDGANSTHNIVLGLSAPFNERLGLGGAPYQFSAHYVDAHAHTTISAHSLHHAPIDEGAPYWSADYETEGGRYLREALRWFPADFATRWLRATDLMLREAPYALDEINRPFYPLTEYVDRMLRLRWQFLGGLAGWGTALALAAAALLSAYRLRWAAAAVFIVLYFAGYSSLQFHARHYFPLEVFYFWTLAFLAHTLAALPARLRDQSFRRELFGQEPLRLWRWPMLHRLAAFALLGAAGLGAYLLLGMYQDRQMNAFETAYREAGRTALEIQREAVDWRTLLIPQDLFPEEPAERERAFRVQPALAAAVIRLQEQPFQLTLRYEGAGPNDFSETLYLPPDANGAKVTLYFPIYQTTDSYFGGVRRFEGLMAPNAFVDDVLEIARIDAPESLPMLLTWLQPETPGAYPKRLAPLPGPALQHAQAYAAFWDNLMPEGAFAHWPEGALAPTGVQPPRAGTRIAPEKRFVFHGNQAVRMTKTLGGADGPPGPATDLAERMFLHSESIPGGRWYHIHVRALNASGQAAPFVAQTATDAGGGMPRFQGLFGGRIWAHPGEWMQEHHTRIWIDPARERQSLILSMGLGEGAAPDRWVVWDAVRLTPAPPPPMTTGAGDWRGWLPWPLLRGAPGL